MSASFWLQVDSEIEAWNILTQWLACHTATQAADMATYLSELPSGQTNRAPAALVCCGFPPMMMTNASSFRDMCHQPSAIY